MLENPVYKSSVEATDVQKDLLNQVLELLSKNADAYSDKSIIDQARSSLSKGTLAKAQLESADKPYSDLFVFLSDDNKSCVMIIKPQVFSTMCPDEDTLSDDEINFSDYLIVMAKQDNDGSQSGSVCSISSTKDDMIKLVELGSAEQMTDVEMENELAIDALLHEMFADTSADSITMIA